jgi:methylmalonyl-CoA/ethylmalonyl-CoA epimerase
MIYKIDHIAIAVENIDKAIEFYENTLGLELAHREAVLDQGVETATFPVGDTAIELVEGQTEESPIRKYVLSKGPGIHHIAFAVDDILQALEVLKNEGVRLVDETPRRGKENSLIAFVHPKSAEGILYELVQPARKPTP